MSRCLGAVLVGALMCAAAGCTIDSFLSPSFVVNGPRTIANGSVTQVAAKLQDGLSDAGMLMYPVQQVSGDLRVAGRKNQEFVFCLHLTESKGSGGKQTRVRMQWDRGGDKELWQAVQKILEKPNPSAEKSSAD